MVADFLKDLASFCRLVTLVTGNVSFSKTSSSQSFLRCLSYVVSMETSEPSPLAARRLVLRFRRVPPPPLLEYRFCVSRSGHRGAHREPIHTACQLCRSPARLPPAVLPGSHGGSSIIRSRKVLMAAPCAFGSSAAVADCIDGVRASTGTASVSASAVSSVRICGCGSVWAVPTMLKSTGCFAESRRTSASCRWFHASVFNVIPTIVCLSGDSWRQRPSGSPTHDMSRESAESAFSVGTCGGPDMFTTSAIARNRLGQHRRVTPEANRRERRALCFRVRLFEVVTWNLLFVPPSDTLRPS